ncbi:hypothetical protein LTR66_011480 [Elasticomyces elasticus]|nr:hypothetical protein LTR66_011480 [Elasticomyces elasticus]
MPKRKRAQDFVRPSQVESGTEPSVNLRQQRVEHKLDLAQKTLFRAFKTARGFERQKLGRRRKQAAGQNDGKNMARIHAEVEALKVGISQYPTTLDLSSTAEQCLYKSLLKSKVVAETPALPPAVLKVQPAPKDHASANVVARLYNSNPVKEALPDILKEIRRALGVEDQNGDVAKRRKVDKDERAENVESLSPATRASQATSSKGALKQRAKETTPVKDDSDDDFTHFDTRIASSSEEDEDDDVKLDTEDGKDRVSANGNKTYPESAKNTQTALVRPRYEPSASASPSATSSMSPLQSSSVSPEPAPSRVKKLRSQPSNSNFLPSLTMGGYWSGSESEPEDDIDVAPKKNRRGQRARQQLWEKKFGTKAKHLQNAHNGSQADRNQGWDPKRGAVDSARGGRGGFGRRDRTGGNDSSAGGQSASLSRGDGNSADVRAAQPQKPSKDNEGPLHPSWEAAKKAKEAKASVVFQGKKITFE